MTPENLIVVAIILDVLMLAFVLLVLSHSISTSRVLTGVSSGFVSLGVNPGDEAERVPSRDEPIGMVSRHDYIHSDDVPDAQTPPDEEPELEEP